MAKKKSTKKEKGQVVDYSLATAVSDVVTVKDIRLINSSCLQTPQALGNKHSLEINYDVEADFDKKQKSVLIFPSFELKGFAEGSKKDEPSVNIQATFLLSYALDKVSGIKKRNVDAFAKTNGIYNAWPYWREFVQNTIARMGLPPLVIPPFRLKPLAEKNKTRKKAKKKKS
jgi:preprotein translocase subunit SecB